MRATDYIVTPADVWRGLRGLGWMRALLLIAVSTLSILALQAGKSTELVLLGYVIATALILRIDARLPFVAAIALLAAIAALSVFDPAANGVKDSPQERLAVLVYYCLVLGVVLLIEEQMLPERAAKLASTQQQHNQPAAVPAASAIPMPAVSHVPASPMAAAQPVARQAVSAQTVPAVLSAAITPGSPVRMHAPQLKRPLQNSTVLGRRMGLQQLPEPVIPNQAVAGLSAWPRQRPAHDFGDVLQPQHTTTRPQTVPVSAGAVTHASVHRTMTQPHSTYQIRRATRRSIDGFVIRQSPAARVQGQAAQYAGI